MIFQKKRGQSLIEILVGLGVGAIIIIGVSTLMVSNLKSSLSVKVNQAASSLAQELINSTKSVAESDWQLIYNLSKGSVNSYFRVASGTQSLIVSGKESVLDNNISSGLVGHWKFDEAAGTIAYDATRNNNSGTLVNNPVSIPLCKIGSCLNFNSLNSTYVNVPDSDVLNPQAISLTAWVYLTESPTANGNIVSKGDNSGYRFRISNTSKVAWFDRGCTNCISSNQIVSQNTWVHIVVTGDSSGLKIFLNGALDNSNVVAYGALNTATSLKIGAEPAYNEYFTGYIDDVRVYNRALTGDEIKNLYNSRIFTRHFYVDNVNRDQCGIGNISSSTPTACALGPGTSGIINDPSTQKTTAVVKDASGNDILSAFEYVIRKRNVSFVQTDWSAGSGQEGPITSPNSAFSASTNITYTSSTGSIYTTAASGTLISSTIDTGMASGTAPNFIIWKGQLNGGTVKFQIASSNNSSGPWTYLGPAGTSDESTDWYSAASDVSMPISLALHNNKRYFRYKVFLYLGTHSPGINDIIINWSP